MYDHDDDYEWFTTEHSNESWRWFSWITLWIVGMIVGYLGIHVLAWIMGVKP